MRAVGRLICAGLASACLASPALAGPLKIAAIGDSITHGVTRSGRRADGTMAQIDPNGGYPGRLQALLGPQVRVLSRGLSGFSAKRWLDIAGASPAAWRVRTFLESSMPGFRVEEPIRLDETYVDYVLDAERAEVVIVFVGINDLVESDPADRDPAEVASRVEALADTARSKPWVNAVLVATLLPNRRDAADAIAETNVDICALEPDCIPTDEAFTAAGGLALLGDEIHPSSEGYAVLAETFAAALRERGLVPTAGAQPRVPIAGGRSAGSAGGSGTASR